MGGVSDLVAEKDSAGEGARGEGTILPPDVQVPYVPPFRYRSAAAWYRCRMTNEKDSSPTRTELMWREYQAGVDLYKFYVEVVIKVLIGYYAITGGILSFYFAKADLPFARWALVLPCVISIALAVLFRWGARLWTVVRDNNFHLAEKLDLSSVFELSAVSMLLNGGSIVIALSGIAILALLILGI
jgi:hypothetical protein